jgi:hypothetical protein
MYRLIAGITVALLGAAPVWAGELDGDFGGAARKAPTAGEKILPASTSTAKLPGKGQAVLAKGSELDDESPTQARRGGWGRGWGGYGRGWGGWGRGWGGWGRGWGGWGWGRGWYGYRGWGWPYYASAWRWGWGWPYYASLWRPYRGYDYGSYYYPYYDYCW